MFSPFSSVNLATFFDPPLITILIRRAFTGETREVTLPKFGNFMVVPVLLYEVKCGYC